MSGIPDHRPPLLPKVSGLFIKYLFPVFTIQRRIDNAFLRAGNIETTKKSKFRIHKIDLPHYSDRRLAEIKQKFQKLTKYKIGVRVLIIGSHRPDETTPYSDVDVLVSIDKRLQESWLKRRIVAKILYKSLHSIYQIDPLQHHGWFIVTDRDLDDWPQLYLPVEVLENASCLVPDEGARMSVLVRKSGFDYLSPFRRLSNHLLDKLEHRKNPRTLYGLKSLLSEFMLLPALYIQAREDRGINKKHSFKAAHIDFPTEEWSSMEEVSRIRAEWNYPLTGWRRYLLTRNHPLMRWLGIKLAPKIPGKLKKLLDSDLYNRMSLLIRAMNEKLDHNT